MEEMETNEVKHIEHFNDKSITSLSAIKNDKLVINLLTMTLVTNSMIISII